MFLRSAAVEKYLRNGTLRRFLPGLVDLNCPACYTFIKSTNPQEERNMTLGEKIQALRKQSGLSQEALAEKLAVTRQTVSKWELNRSMPDLDFIARLSELFEVSADYLIKDDRSAPDDIPNKAPDGPQGQKKTFHFTQKTKLNLLAALSILELIAVFVCLVCDYFTGKSLSWSLIAAASMAAAWFILLPVLAAKENILFKALLAMSIVPFPLLAVLALLLKKAVIFTLGSCITLVCIAALFGIYKVFLHFRARLWRAFGFALLVILPVPIAITALAARFLPQVQLELPSTAFNSGITLLLALACFGADSLHTRKAEDKR